MAALHSGDWDDAIAISHDVLRDSPISAQNNEADCYPAIMAGLRGDGGQWLARHIAAYEPIAHATSNPQYAALSRVLHGWQALIQGDLRRTADDVDEDPTVEPTYGASMYWLAGHAAVWLRDRERAERLIALMEALAVRGLWSTASMRGMNAGISALAGRTAEANTAFSDAGRTMRELGLPLDTALLLMDQVAVVGTADPAGHSAADEAREILTRLGASVLLDRLDALTGDGGSAVGVEAAAETAASTEVVG
jgi:hypothetical protein